MHVDPAWIALIGTLCGGLGLKIVEHTLNRGKVKRDDAAALRNELRESIDSQKADIKELEADVEKWRREYYDLRDKYATAQAEAMIKMEQLKQLKREQNE